ISAQRSYSANAKVVNVADQLSQRLLSETA
ncbi:MAG: hypothetical protein JO270_26495, partial [Acidobacteriaceae bacterium]|nr:hypothetical protein [Acidobacteriaceae bacterium]